MRRRRGIEAFPVGRFEPNPNLVDWLEANPVSKGRPSALVVGCGLGDDAEFLAREAFRSPRLMSHRRRSPGAKVGFPARRPTYVSADLLAPPTALRHVFDFVLEAYTLQVLPRNLREQAISRLADTVEPGGTLLVICRGRLSDDPEGEMPWPLLRDELFALDRSGLPVDTFEDLWDPHEEPAVRRFRACYSRPVA